MARKTRAEKRAEEAKIVAEMEEAMRENGLEIPSKEVAKSGQKEKIHCKRCKALMENGVCPVCGFRVYTPMDAEKRKKIRRIVAISCLAVFLVLFLVLRLT